MLSTILKNKEVFKRADTGKGVKAFTKQKGRKLLLIWINENQSAGDSISGAIICEKAKQLHGNLLK